MTVTISGTSGIVNDATDLNYTGTLTGGTGVVNLGSGQVYKDASGNVGIGTVSNLQPLGVGNASANTLALLRTGVSATAGNIGPSINFYLSQTATTSQTGDANLARVTASPIDSWGGVLQFFSKPADGNSGGAVTERARIDSSGNLLVGGTSSSDTTKIGIIGGAAVTRLLNCQVSHTTAFGAIGFVNGNGTVGSISMLSNSVTYNTSSDYRLKENIASMTGALAAVQQLNPVTYTWKSDGSDGQGFIAHELAEIVPECVTGEKDAVEEQQYEVTPAVKDEEGNTVTEAVMGTRTVPVYQGIDTSFLVATLTAAIQEQQTLIVSLQDTLTALTARITALEAQIV